MSGKGSEEGRREILYTLHSLQAACIRFLSASQRIEMTLRFNEVLYELFRYLL